MNRFNKKGSMLMMVMIMLIVAAILAMRLMPNEQTVTQRSNEAFYNSDLSQLREAIDLVRLAAKDPDPNNKAFYDPVSNPSGWQDFQASDTPEIISARIASMSKWGFLRKTDVRDNSVPAHLWGKNATQSFWLVSTNYASNTSFEIDSADEAFISVGWEAAPEVNATVTPKIRLNSMAIDEYPYQNKLGDNTRGENAIKMISITK